MRSKESPGPEFLNSELVPRVHAGPSLWTIPPRLVRAGHRFGDMNAHFDRMVAEIQGSPKVTVALADMDHPNPPFELDISEVLLGKHAMDLRLLVSEILHHLRSAADHLVFNVAWSDGGREQAKTQFPVCSTRKQFQNQGTKMLNGVNAEHRRWIEEVQPYNGVTWTRSLAYLSNNDKHNYLLEVVPTLSYRMRIHEVSPLEQDPRMGNVPVDNLVGHVRLIRREGGEYRKVEDELGDVMEGLSTLVNRFLREAGISEIEVGGGQ